MRQITLLLVFSLILASCNRTLVCEQIEEEHPILEQLSLFPDFKEEYTF
ncbi:MAG: hypothetical protein AAF740_13720 [Bacteroidota bacterium]